MTILEEEKHTASASSAGSSNKDSHSPINSVSPSSGIQQTSITSVVTSGQQQQGSASTAAQTAVTRITSSSEVNVTKNHLLSNMISNVADRYITPEYLAPLPSSVSHKPKTVNTTSIFIFKNIKLEVHSRGA